MRRYFLLLFFFLALVYQFDLGFAAENLTIKKATLPSPRYSMGCAEDSSTHKIYCFSGQTGSSFTDSIIEYDSSSDRLRIMNSLFPFGIGGFDCVENSLTHKIYCFGGQNPAIDQILEYSVSLPLTLFILGNTTVQENTTLLLQLNATDEDNKPLTFETNAAGILPSPFFFNQTSGLFIWTPTYRDQGQYNVTFGVTDGRSRVSETVTLTVLDRRHHEIIVEGDPKLGTKINITSADSYQPGRYYFLLMGLGNTGFTLSDGRHVPLDPDGLFYVSLAYPLFIGLLGSQGQLDGYGEAKAIWGIPNIPPLAGLDVYFVFLTFDPGKKMPEAVLSISPSAKIKLAS